MIEIKEVVSKSDWKKFAAFPVKLYKENPHYVPSFLADDENMANPKKNFAAQNCKVKAFLAYEGKTVVGRIAAIIVEESNRKFGEKAVRFSRFDFIEDIEVAKALLNAAIEFGKSQGMTRIHGPWGFNDTDREGMLTYGFDKAGSYATNYNYAYYPEFMRELGYADESVWIEEKVDFPKPGTPQYDKYIRLGEFVKKKYRLRELTETMSVRKIVSQYGDKFFDCYNAAYSVLDMYVDITGEAKKAVLKQFASIVSRKFLSVLVDEKDDVVAFCVMLSAIGPALKKHGGKGNIFALLDILKLINHPKTLELTLIAVRPDFAKRGYTAACISKLIREIDKADQPEIVSDPTLESNTAVRAQWAMADSEVIKRRQTYTKDI